jgi:hypothetical protein
MHFPKFINGDESYSKLLRWGICENKELFGSHTIAIQP